MTHMIKQVIKKGLAAARICNPALGFKINPEAKAAILLKQA